MVKAKFTTGAALLTLFAITTLAQVASRADGLQDNKNMFRNLAIGSAVVAGLGLIDHNSTLTVAGVAGAAIAGSQYEQDRHVQSVQQNDCGYVQGNWNGYNGGYNRGIVTFDQNGYDRQGGDRNWNQDQNRNQNWNRNDNQGRGYDNRNGFRR